jgi:beta-phosphoglucomutase
MKNKFTLPAGVLFDFDGVVVDSFDSHYGAWKAAFLKLFKTEIPEFPHDKLAGKSPYIIAEYFCNTVRQPEKSVAFFKLKGEYLHNSTNPPHLLPGVVEIQTFLSNKNIPHGIASNATRLFVKNSVSQLKLGFTTLFGLEDYTHPKPHPEAYLTLARTLNIAKDNYPNTWVFEDSIPGTQAAIDAGMVPIGILTLHTEETMFKAGSYLCFPTLLEAYHYLSKTNKPLLKEKL